MKNLLADWREAFWSYIEDREGPADPQVKLTPKQKAQTRHDYADNESPDGQQYADRTGAAEEADGQSPDGQ
jgi:hypothetical protein